MVNELDILEQIQAASGKKEKRAILEQNKDNERLGDLLDAALNFFRKFHIHKFEVVHEVNEGEIDLHSDFLSLLDRLENRMVTGHDAKIEVELFLFKCSEFQKKWYSRILRKDLKIGISVDTAAKYFNIPTFDVMLAKDGKQCKKKEEIISKGVYASPKLDGYRCFAIIRDGKATLHSRNGSVYENFPIIKESLEKLGSKDNTVGDVILDGEIISDDFQSMQRSAFASKRGDTVGDVKFHVFDTLDVREWDSGEFKEKKSDRYSRLKSIASDFDSNLKLVEQELVTSLDKILELERKYLAAGYEGAMAVPDIPYYKGKKSNRMLKFKTMESQDCEITGFYEGKAGTRLEGKLGGFKLKQENGLTCECGSGFSDEDRDYIWHNKSEFLGRIIEVKYQELSNHNIMRFPVFVRFRDLGKGTGKI